MANKPTDLTRTWASGAPAANIKDPDVVDPGKYAAGWLAEIPPFEYFNFLHQLITQTLAHLNEHGIMDWDTATVYPIGGLVMGTDNIVYRAVISQSGNNPVGDGGTNWLVYVGAIPDAASAAEQEAGSEAGKYVAPAVQQRHLSAAKAWVSFNGTGVVAIIDDYNVTSITDNGTGNYDINFTTAFANANYGWVGSARAAATFDAFVTSYAADVKTVSVLEIKIKDSTSNLLDAPEVNVACFGDQ